jgi:hypothetical protein
MCEHGPEGGRDLRCLYVQQFGATSCWMPLSDTAGSRPARRARTWSEPRANGTEGALDNLLIAKEMPVGEKERKRLIRKIEKVMDDMPIECQVMAAAAALSQVKVGLSSFCDLMARLAHAQLAGVLTEEQDNRCAALSDEMNSLLGGYMRGVSGKEHHHQKGD